MLTFGKTYLNRTIIIVIIDNEMFKDQLQSFGIWLKI